MPRKKSVKRATVRFCSAVDETLEFVETVSGGCSDAHVSRIYDAAIIELYRDFESLVLDLLVGSINNDTKTISKTLGVEFPKHLTDEVCYYLVTGPSYFDFKGRSGLIKRLKQYVPDSHYGVTILKQAKYTSAIDRLCALRNYAAHGSPQSQRAVLQAVEQKRIGTAGSWLKTGSRLEDIAHRLKELAHELEEQAPY